MEIMYNEKTGQWEEYQGPFASVNFTSREDLERLIEVVEFWNAHHPEDMIDTAALRRYCNG